MINKKRLLSLTQKILSINSENPPGHEDTVSKFIFDYLMSLGLPVKKYTFAKRRPNVVATLKGTWPRRKAAREAILLTPHMDTVPVGKGWKYNPWGKEIIRGKIYGRGATDDKGNLACALEVMQSLVEDHVRLKRDIILAATVDEETGSHYGIIPLLEKKILRPAKALILDADEFDAIICQKGLIHCRVQIFGKKAHGAYNWRGVNAIELAAQIIAKIKARKLAYKKHPLLRGPTTNIGVIKGGDKVNMVADFCEFALDWRFLPGMAPGNILKDLRKIIRGVTPHFKIKIDAVQLPYEISRQHPLVKAYVQAGKKENVTVRLKGSEGATVITFFKKHHIPAFATGFGAHGTAHTNDEYAKISTLFKGAQILERFIKDCDAA